MGNGRQQSGGIAGINSLAYQGATPNLVTFNRRPTVQDGFSWPVGMIWIIPINDAYATGEFWTLVSKADGINTWKRLRGTGGGPTPPVSDVMVNKIFLTTPGAGTYTPTTDMIQCYVECQGGGSGAGNPLGAGVAGSAGGYCAKMFTSAEIGASQSYSVGDGGAGGDGVAGSNGGNTTFGSFLTANGGSAAVSVNLAVGGTATGGDINIQGQSSIYSSAIVSTGGSSVFGFGAGVNPNVNTAIKGTGYGSGPNGAVTTPSTQHESGQPGIIIITEYIG